MRQKLRVLSLCILAIGAGCSDTSQTTTTPGLTPTGPSMDVGRGSSDERYVAIGTSVSMGWASNGVYDASQRVSWPALLSFAGGGMSLPLIQSPGCTSPIVAPLGAGKRLSGESIAGSTVCAPNDVGVVLPAQNVALAAALAADAVQTTPEASSYPWFGRVLPPGTTQLTATLAQHPTFVSVELGANEVLNASSGLVVPGVTMVPLPFFVAPYDALLDGLKSQNVKAVLAGLPSDARNLAAIRRADEIWADRAEFAALHVDVSSDCNGSPNYINVSIKSLNAVLTAAFTSTHGLPNPVFSCADIPGTQDLVLTPADMATVNTLLGQMTAHIKEQAAARGYAYFSLGVLYDAGYIKNARYSVITQLSSRTPYGAFISLDGVHPSALGHVVLARAAALAIDAKYHNGVHALRTVADASLANQLVEPVLPAVALEQARAFALAHQGEQMPACPITNGCDVTRAGRVR